MAQTIVVQPPQRIARGALIGAALAGGLSNLAASLFTVAQRRAEDETRDKALAQQWQVALMNAQQSQAKQDSLDRYRAALLDAKQQGILSTKDYREALLGFRADEAAARQQHYSVLEDLGRARLDLSRSAEARRATAQTSPKPAKPNELQMLTEDRDLLRQGKAAQHYPGLTLEEAEQGIRKRILPYDPFGTLAPTGGATLPAPPPTMPAPSTPAAMPVAPQTAAPSPAPTPQQTPVPGLPPGWNVQIVP